MNQPLVVAEGQRQLVIAAAHTEEVKQLSIRHGKLLNIAATVLPMGDTRNGAVEVFEFANGGWIHSRTFWLIWGNGPAQNIL